MSWASLDDGFADHPKVLPLSSDAFRLHVCAMCWCNRRGTDGIVLTRELRILAGMLPDGLDVRGLVAELVAARLWDQAADGWALHDFLDWNEPAAKVKAKREAHAQRQKAARAKARDTARDGSRDIARASTHPLPLLNTLTPARGRSQEPDPLPVPVPPTTGYRPGSDDDAVAAWEAIQNAAGGREGLGLKRDYGGGHKIPLAANKALFWVHNWTELRKADPPPTLADCQKLGRWIAAGGPGDFRNPWEMLAKAGHAPHIGAWFDQALRWDGVSDLRSRGVSPRAPAAEPVRPQPPPVEEVSEATRWAVEQLREQNQERERKRQEQDRIDQERFGEMAERMANAAKRA